MTADSETTKAPAQSAGWRGKFAGFALPLSVFAVLWFMPDMLGPAIYVRFLRDGAALGAAVGVAFVIRAISQMHERLANEAFAAEQAAH